MKKPASRRDETLDTLFQGRLKIFQRKGGYRFSVDAVLLARFCQVHGGERIIDLGTGSGIIPIILASLHPAVRITGLELQREMAERAVKSVLVNHLEEKIQIVQGDVRAIDRLFPPQSFDAVVCNPPYRGAARGRINPDPEKRVARHEIRARLSDFVRAGCYLLRRGGRMTVVYPAARMPDLIQTMRQEKLEPKRLRLVHSFEGSQATLVLAEGVKEAGSELKVLPPLVVYTREKKYTAEVKAILGE